jgi:hypothetical protein
MIVPSVLPSQPAPAPVLCAITCSSAEPLPATNTATLPPDSMSR